MNIKSSLLAVCVISLTLPAFAKKEADSSKGKCSKAECSLVCDIAQDGMAEVKLGKLAESKGNDQKVKDFGKHMVTDHSKANDELKEAAQKDGITLPTDVNAKQKSTYEALNKLSGKAFDDKYVAEMVKGHKTAVAAITKESETGTAEAKAWAVKTLPTVKEHLKDIEGMQGQVK